MLRLRLVLPRSALLRSSLSGRPAALALRALSSKPSDGTADDAGPAPPPAATADGMKMAGDDGQGGSGGLSLQDHEGDNLPPLAFEPGIAGAAQKGVSAVVIVFGAAAFGACAWGAAQALFPSASATGTIFSEAFEKVQADPEVAYALGTPLKAHGIDHGGGRGRRNAMERWEVSEGGADYSIVRFTVAGPQGNGVVQAQVPTSRGRGDFRYIIFENRRSRSLVHVLDNRAAEMAAANAAAEAAAAEEAAAATKAAPAAA